ncbi:AraC family transcriptional regulator [Olsenella sp. SW781]|uniref:helix-turn-helix transcriptional regulator n=1 Tax=Olsenella sp. SW781 TaxID=2530046 RepID=UPI00143A0CC2|nr:helix-turn-helix domain-containing protein [Olsenella sp. SW781]NJE80502.1 AraC family transcriptional regulator [Olsenella sp. SW781]
MDRHVEEILERQESFEEHAYRHADLIREMVSGDFSDAATLLAEADAHKIDLVRLFHHPDFPEIVRQFAIPTRTSPELSVHKHTRLQVPYWHRHDFFELVFVLRGQTIQRIEGADAPLRLGTGGACLVPPGTVHLMERAGAGDTVLKMSVPPTLFAKVGNPISQLLMDREFVLLDGSSARADYLACQLVRECAERPPHWGQAAASALSLLFVELSRDGGTTEPEIARQLACYLDRTGTKASLDGFAEHVGYSRRYVARLLRERCGHSFSELCLAHRMREARKLLLESDRPISSIAFDLGYSNPSGFYKRFEESCGMTPSVYRRLFSSS